MEDAGYPVITPNDGVIFQRRFRALCAAGGPHGTVTNHIPYFYEGGGFWLDEQGRPAVRFTPGD
jgi:hypothetical protein